MDNTEEIKSITAHEFAKLNFDEVTLFDLREPDEVLVSGIDGAINIPFSQIAQSLNQIPKDKPVYVYCRTGDWSEEVTEILADWGYDAYNLSGGYKAYKDYLESSEPIFVDAKNLKCPGPIVKVTDIVKDLKIGQQIYVEATEDAFSSDIAVWCQRTGNELLKLDNDESIIKALIKKQEKVQKSSITEEKNDKTFVVFSGDLDKTIAAFIMANGAAAMGRNITMFFTF